MLFFESYNIFLLYYDILSLIYIVREVTIPFNPLGADAMYTRYWFEKRDGSNRTAALVMETEKLNALSVSAISRVFPYSEFMRMEVFQRLDGFADFESAFAADSESTP